MTQTRDPFAVMLRGAFFPTLAVGPVAVLVGTLTGGLKGALGAFLGFAVAIAFFALGLVIMRKLDSASDPFRFLASALAVFLGQLIFLFLVIISLQGAQWLDATAFGIAVLAVALVWQVFQVVAYVRSRKPVFDEATHPVQDEGSTP
jgi:ATP synthase protein I